MASEAKIILTAQDNTKAAFDSVKAGLGGISSMASAAGISLTVLGAAGTLAGLVAMAKRINDGVDALNDLSDATGASVENISALERVAKMTGVSIDTVGQSLIKYNQALASTLKPGSDAENVLKAIGLNAKELRALDPAEALRQTAVALNQFANDGSKARAVQELFGKSLKEVAPFLKDLAESGALVATVTKQQAEEAEKFNHQLFAFSKNAEDAGRSIVSHLLPPINALLKNYREIREMGGMGLILKDASKGIAGLGRMTGNHGADINALIKERTALEATIAEAAKTIIPSRTDDPSMVGANRRLRADTLKTQRMNEIGELNDYIKILQIKQRNEIFATTDYADASDAVSRRHGRGRKTIGDLPDTTAAAAAASAAAAAHKKELQEQAKVIAEVNGVTVTYMEDLTRYQAMRAKGTLSEEQYTEALIALIGKQPGAKKQMDEQAEAAKLYTKNLNELHDAEIKRIENIEKANAPLAAQNQALTEEIELIGLSEAAQHALVKARLSSIITIKEEQLARMQNAEFMSREQIALEEEIRLLKERQALQDGKFIAGKAAKEAEESTAAWKSFYQDLERGLTDSLFRAFESGKGFFSTLWSGIKNLFKTTVLKMLIQPTVGGIMGALGMPASASTGGAGSSTLSSIGIVATLSKVYTAITTGFTTFGTAFGNTINQVGGQLYNMGAEKLGSAMIEGSTAVGTAAGYAAGAAAGIVLGRAISGEFSAFGSNKNTAVVAGTAIGAIWGPLGAAIGGAIGGLVNRAFGMGAKQSTATGITGTFSAESASLKNFQDWYQKGGWFRSDRSGTDYSAMDGGANQALNQALQMTSGAVRTYASLIGLSADAVKGFSQAIHLNLAGLGAADAEKAVLNAIGNFGEAMATTAYGIALQSFKMVGETTTAALSRLATDLTSVNTAFRSMGRPLVSISLLGADAASKLVAMAGGMESFRSQTDAYYVAFYSDAERTANVTRQLTDALGSINLAMPTTRAAFRRLVEAQDLMTDAGRTAYTMLIALAPAFAEVTPALEGTADAIKLIADAVKTMTGSALGLRGAVLSARMRQLSPAQSLAQQQGDFANSYSMALSTTGTTQAGYADKLTAALPGLSEALMATARTREEWALSTSTLFAQSETIAQQLDAASKSAERVIADAVTAGSKSTASGLRAVVAALTGQDIPTFAAGGPFSGGLRIVGESGPELEATGPSRIYSAGQTRTLMSGGNNADMVQELRALRQEVQGLRAEAQATASHTHKTAKILSRVTQNGEAITTTALP